MSLVLALTLAVLYSGYSALNAVVAQAPQFKTLAGDAQSGMVLFAVLAVLFRRVSLRSGRCEVFPAPCADAIRIAETVAAGDLSHDFDNARGANSAGCWTPWAPWEDALHRPGNPHQGQHATPDGHRAATLRTPAPTSCDAPRCKPIAGLNGSQHGRADVRPSAKTRNAPKAQAPSRRAHPALPQRGGEVGEVVSTMQAITDSSRKVVDIVAVIEGISFQTNILALNAAVEAARAGEPRPRLCRGGQRGALIGRAQLEAAKEIRRLISHFRQNRWKAAPSWSAAPATPCKTS